MMAWLLVAGCNQRDAAQVRLNTIGPERLVSAAEPLRQSTIAGTGRPLPKAEWPTPIEELKPQVVIIAKHGVFVRLQKRFVSEAGVYVAFPGINPPAGPGNDPHFEPMAPRVYWYEIKG
jgi:hypothetical protein